MTLGVVAARLTYSIARTQGSIEAEPRNHSLLSKCPPCLEVIKKIDKKSDVVEKERTFVKRVEVKPSENF